MGNDLVFQRSQGGVAPGKECCWSFNTLLVSNRSEINAAKNSSISSRLFIAYPLRNRSSAVSFELDQSERSVLRQTGTNSNCGNSDKKRPPAKSRRFIARITYEGGKHL